MPSSLSSSFARALVCALFLLALTASSALGATRTGLAVDPVGDGPTPGRDITGVRIHWDSAGSLAVTAVFAGPVSAADRAQLTANARAAVGRACQLESQATYLLLSGYTGPASSDDRGFGIGSPGWLSLDTGRVRDDAGRTVTLYLDDPRIGEYDLGCVDVRLSADGVQVDGVAPVFFGDGVDTDQDGVDDNRDVCLSTAGSAANGCEAALRDAHAQLERVEPPAPATALHRRLLGVVEMNAEFAAESTALARYLPRARKSLRRVGRIGEQLRVRLQDATTPSAQADALTRYARAIERRYDALYALQPPPILLATHRAQLGRLSASSRLARQLRSASEARDSGRVAELLLEFRAVSRQSGRSRLTRSALREYNDRYHAINQAAADMRREQGRLEQRLG